MKRQHPLASFLSLLFTLLLLSWLALILWRSGGEAFSPGRLTASAVGGAALNGFRSHADFEQECARCHAPLETTQDQLCLACHTEVAQQLESGAGTHALIEDVQRCAECHSDHHGVNYDPLQAAFTAFDHDRTSFSLLRHQVDAAGQALSCHACHTDAGEFVAAAQRCIDCHREMDAPFMDQHVADFGQAACQACHDGSDHLARFDHSDTNFPLEGSHGAVRCAQCHNAAPIPIDRQAALAMFASAETDCQACHDEPAAHQGLFGQDCAACHTPQAWLPARWQAQPFDHWTTGFSLARHPLDYAGEALVCADCHRQPLAAGELAFDLQSCIDCHAQDPAQPDFIAVHQAAFGANCLVCHDGIDRLSNFDHNDFFPLDGAHANAECTACHVDQVFRDTPSACVACHAEPEIHAGFFGLQCEACHTTSAWRPAQLRVHRFPLDHGGQGEVACTTCHPGPYTENTCYACHEHQPQAIQASHLTVGIEESELLDCTACHADGRIDANP